MPRKKKKSDAFLQVELKERRGMVVLEIQGHVEFDDDEQAQRRRRSRKKVDANTWHLTFQGYEEWYKDEINKFAKTLFGQVVGPDGIFEKEDMPDAEAAEFFRHWNGLLGQFQQDVAARMKAEEAA